MSSKIVASAIVLSFCAAVPATPAEVQLECSNKTLVSIPSHNGALPRLVYRQDPLKKDEWIAWLKLPTRSDIFMLQAHSATGKFGDGCIEANISTRKSGSPATYEAISGFFVGCNKSYGKLDYVGEEDDMAVFQAFGNFPTSKGPRTFGDELKPFWQSQLDAFRLEAQKIDESCTGKA